MEQDFLIKEDYCEADKSIKNMSLKDDLRGTHVYLESNAILCLKDDFSSDEPFLHDIKDLISENEIKISIPNSWLKELFPCGLLSSEDKQEAKEIRDFLNYQMPGHKRIVDITGKNKCDLFLTNDKDKQIPDGLKRILLSDYKNDFQYFIPSDHRGL